ncbi:MAG: hypothetical protein ACOH2P_01140 [Pseudomonas sp.]
MSEPFVLVNLDEHYPDRFPSNKRSGGDDNDRRPPGPLGDNPLEPRVSKLETHIEYVRRDLGELRVDFREHRKETRTDFRLLFSALITAALGLAAMMGKGFGWL